MTRTGKGVPSILAALLCGIAYGIGRMQAGLPAATPATGAPATTAAGRIYTCSMHPQIRLPNPGLCPICAMDLIPVDDAAPAGGGPATVRLSPEAVALARIRTEPTARREVSREIRMVGRIEVDETRVQEISARFPGRLDRLFVDYTGVAVRSGDHLASIYSPELLSAQEELVQALAAARTVTAAGGETLRRATLATVEAAREKLRLWGLSPEQVRAIEAGRTSDHLTLHAARSGIVIRKNAIEGAYVAEGQSIYTIADLTRVWVLLEAYESDLAWLRYGQAVRFEAEAYPGEPFEGRIAFLSPVLDPSTRTVKVRVNVENTKGQLKPGMFVRAGVKAPLSGGGLVYDQEYAGKWISPMHPEVVEDGPGPCRVCGIPLVPAETLGFASRRTTVTLPLVIPATAPLLTGRRAVVYVAVPGAETPTYQARVVTLGPRAEDWWVVRDGLREGERVVVQGAFKIDSAVQIAGGASMMTMPDEAGSSGAAPGDPVLWPVFRVLEAGLDAVAEALARRDPDAASPAFAAVRAILADLPVSGLRGEARSRAEALVSELDETAGTGAEAWELPEQRRALLRLGSRLESLRPETGPAAPSARPALVAVVELARNLAAALAADDLERARRTLAGFPGLPAPPLPGAVTDRSAPSPATAGGERPPAGWQLSLALADLAEAGDLEAFRRSFAVLSDLVLVQLARQPALSGEVEILACPMAFAGRGARWIQAPGPIANPYFGAAMLRCGETWSPASGKD